MRYRMADLCRLTGLSRQAIHFYIREGLVPEGQKTGHNFADYDERHLDRILLIRRLQHERFLPLRAIKALVEGEDASLSPAQRGQLAEIKARVGAVAGLRGSGTERVADLLRRTGVDKADFAKLVELGLLAPAVKGRGAVVSSADAWIVELWGQVRAAGFSRALGFEPDLLEIFADAVQRMFKREKELLATLLERLPAERVAAMVERALPLIDAFLVRYHRAKVHELFEAST
jgi:DNA-binding transcriptional MerR regulator